MRIIYLLISFFLLTQCGLKDDKSLVTKTIYLTDTVYIETSIPEDSKPWELECIDSADTQLDMNVCSLECYLIADSVTSNMYNHLLNLYNEKINQSQGDYKNYCNEQKNRIRLIRDHFNEIEELASQYSYKSYEGGTIAPLMLNSMKTMVLELEIKLFDNLLFEAENI